MKKSFSILMCIALIMALIPQQQASAYNATSMGTIVSGQEYSGITPVNSGGNHERIRFELPIGQDSIIRIILYTQSDSDTVISLDSPYSPYESPDSYGSFNGSDLTIVNDFYNPITNVFSTSCYGVTADKRNTVAYTEVFGSLVKGTYYIVLSGSSYRFKVCIEPLTYQGDNSNPNATMETAAFYTIGNEQEGVLVPNGIINNSFIDYQKMMNSWYKFTGEKGSYQLTFKTDGFFQGTCSVLGSDGYPVNGTEIKAVANYSFGNSDPVAGTYEDHVAMASVSRVNFNLPKAGTYYININRRSWTDGSYLFKVTSEGEIENDVNDTGDAAISDAEIILNSVIIEPGKASVKAGAKVSLKALATYSDSTTEDMTEFVTWSSSNNKIATVDDQGVVKGVAAGTATITATLEGKKTSISVSVTEANKLSKIVPAKATVYLKVGATATNKITAYYADGTKKVVTANTSYKSSSSDILVSKKGLIKASKKGKYTITATYGGKKTTFKVVVK